MTHQGELLIGCGGTRDKRVVVNGTSREWTKLHTLDINPDHNPDTVWDLTKLPLPFQPNSLTEIHAYEVLEHTGQQGDYQFFFAQFSDFWRMLKPGGWLLGTVPAATSPWVWGDPSHTRAILPETFMFLSQQAYKDNVGKNAMSDFRYIYKADFEMMFKQVTPEFFAFGLQAVKPSRYEEKTK